jgi:hypothetical protein
VKLGGRPAVTQLLELGEDLTVFTGDAGAARSDALEERAAGEPGVETEKPAVGVAVGAVTARGCAVVAFDPQVRFRGEETQERIGVGVAGCRAESGWTPSAEPTARRPNRAGASPISTGSGTTKPWSRSRASRSSAGLIVNSRWVPRVQ